MLKFRKGGRPVRSVLGPEGAEGCRGGESYGPPRAARRATGVVVGVWSLLVYSIIHQPYVPSDVGEPGACRRVKSVRKTHVYAHMWNLEKR